MENKIHKELPSGIRYIGKTEKCFPKKLLELQDCPQGIYVRGKLPDPKKKTVAIVGARKCEENSKVITEKISYNLAKNDIVLVSGMAIGIDSVAHEACLKANGKTIAVLRFGI